MGELRGPPHSCYFRGEHATANFLKTLATFAVGFAVHFVFVALLGGLLPAWKAARMPVVDALRQL